MGTRYTSQSLLNYNASPPIDDGTASQNNQVAWAKHLAKIGNPLKTMAEGMNTQLVTALSTTCRSISNNDTITATDHLKTIQISSATTAAITISLPDATAIANGFIVTIANESAFECTIARTTGTDTINTVTANTSIMPSSSIVFIVNSDASGYIKTAEFVGLGYQQVGATSVPISLDTAMQEIVTAARANIKFDDSTDNSATMNTFIAEHVGTALFFSKGIARFASAVTIGVACAIYSPSPDAVTFRTTSATEHILNVTASDVQICGINFDSTVARTAGAFVRFTASGNHRSLTNFRMTGAFYGVELDGGAIQYVGAGNGIASIRDTVATTGQSIRIINGPLATTIHGVVMDAGAGSQPEAGVFVSGCGDVTLSECNIIHQGTDLLIAPANGETVTSLVANHCYFDTALGGIAIIPTGTGAVVRCRFTDCWFSSHTGYGALITGNATSNINGVEFTRPHIFGNSSDGFHISVTTGVSAVSISGAKIAGNVSGVVVNGAINGLEITDSVVGPWGGFGGNSDYGIFIAGQITNSNIFGNNLTGNTTAALAIAAGTPGANSRIENNRGYNPLGVNNITVGASPFSYTVGYATETICISGAAVNSVAINGANVHTNTDVSVTAGPGSTVLVTFPGAVPGMVTYRH